MFLGDKEKSFRKVFCGCQVSFVPIVPDAGFFFTTFWGYRCGNKVSEALLSTGSRAECLIAGKLSQRAMFLLGPPSALS